MRADADAKYLYWGSQKGCGRRRGYGNKVKPCEVEQSHWIEEGQIRKGIGLRSAVYHRSLKRTIKVAMLYRLKDASDYALLFSTDLKLMGWDIVGIYRARFQIEFLFRDAKQSLGLEHCQARDTQKMQFHWNTVIAARNPAKLETSQDRPKPFSMASYKQRRSNEHLLKVFFDKLGLDWTCIKSNPAFPRLCNYGVIAT